MTELMHQQAEMPTILCGLVERLDYKGWRIDVVENLDRGQGSEGLTLVVRAVVKDTYHDHDTAISHYFPVPPAAYDERSWRRWLLDCILLVEQHEACEYFKVDGERPFAPHHGPGNNPYTIFEHGTDEDVRTSFRGEVNA